MERQFINYDSNHGGALMSVPRKHDEMKLGYVQHAASNQAWHMTMRSWPRPRLLQGLVTFLYWQHLNGKADKAVKAGGWLALRHASMPKRPCLRLSVSP
jgi:hypothetical protein